VDTEGSSTPDAEPLLAVLDGVSVLLHLQAADGRVMFANRAACELIGKAPEEVVGRMPDELFDPETVARWGAQNEQVLRTRRPLDVEDAWGGRVFLSHKAPVLGADGEPVAVIGLSTEITEQKRAEDALRLSEERLAEAQQIAGVGSWHWDPETRQVDWSPELRRLYGLAEGDDPTGEEVIAFVHPDDRDKVREAAQSILRSGGTMALELRIVRADGEERLVLCRAGATLGPDGRARRLDGTCEDVTERRRAEQRLAEAQRLAQIGSFDRDLEADEVTWSPETYRIFGVDPEHLVPSRGGVLEMVVPEDRERLRGEVDRAIREDGGFDCFVTIRRAGGELRDLRIRGAVHRAAGAPRHLIGICQDLTEIHAAERARIELDERFRSVFERAPVGIALVARGGRFSLVNEALAEFLARSREELVGMRVEDVTHPDDMPESSETLRRMAAGELDEWNTTRRYVRPDGEVRWGALRALLLHDAEGRSSECLALVRDVTDQRRAERRRAAAHGVLSVMAGGSDLRDALPALLRTVVEKLGWARGSLWLFGADGEPALEAAWPRGSAPERPSGRLQVPVVRGAEAIGVLEFDGDDGEPAGEALASFTETLGAQLGEFIVRRRAEEQRLHEALHDPLTGLPNRVLFFDRLDHALRRQQREHVPLAVLFLDFDGFKAVNDEHGHAVGDEVLRCAAGAVASTLRAEDTVARFGGDELVVLSEHIADREGAGRIAQRILDRLREPIELEGHSIALSASIGICVAPLEGRTRDELLGVADDAMYEAKAAGPGRYVIAE
jgi:diguanylate cyclase (GGDEF)-like protein/PAS domain S-box-containing protein